MGKMLSSGYGNNRWQEEDEAVCLEDSRLIGGLFYAWRKKIDLFSSEHNVVDSSAITMGSFRARTHANSYCSCLHVALLEWRERTTKTPWWMGRKANQSQAETSCFKVLYVLSPS
ncbi:hypothetical protein MUK42_19257 [Musa troglodytarum]|uniref:Uncharacterized protein n=1 Tax=Musa troglodytarum TaxID=320322 RepID=A0A9E7G0V2_9LILI|nr:hypothetical protein MUK42_19257 [Musa troglodytarum]